MGNPWSTRGQAKDTHGQPTGNPRINRGKRTGNPWETRGASCDQPLDNLWSTHGQSVGIPWATRGQPTQHMGSPQSTHGVYGGLVPIQHKMQQQAIGYRARPGLHITAMRYTCYTIGTHGCLQPQCRNSQAPPSCRGALDSRVRNQPCSVLRRFLPSFLANSNKKGAAG